MPRLRHILLLLFLGAVVNVLVAWGCARWATFDPLNINERAYDIDVPTSITTREPALVSNASNAPYRPSRWLRMTSSGFGRTYEHYSFERGDSEDWRYHTIESFGLPCNALCFQRSPKDTRPVSDWYMPGRVTGWRGGFSLHDPRWFNPGPERILPLVPLPLGFTINTFFYAVLLYLPFAAFSTLRRRRRLRRNLCPSCGYSLAGAVPTNNTITCPECGKPSSCGEPSTRGRPTT
jgi:hypothetical protein